MAPGTPARQPALDRGKFDDPQVTATGKRRAVVALTHLKTLWFNTGSLCNLSCDNCYMESSPDNDRLAYMSAAEVSDYLEEAKRLGLPVEEIGFTGGEPFMNREFPAMIEDALSRGFRVLILTNAMKPLGNRRPALLALRQRYGDALTLRVSVDHHRRQGHDEVRGEGAWEGMMEGLQWLAGNGFHLTVAGRTRWGEPEADARRAYGGLFSRLGVPVDAGDPAQLMLFPEMDAGADAPEISVSCWDILGARPEEMMCASSRMVIKRKGDQAPVVVPCTVLPYGEQFELGRHLAAAAAEVSLNHPHCAQFCVLGGSTCS